MGMEEKDIYSLDEDDFDEDALDDIQEDEDYDDHIMYHNFYGY